MPRSPRHTFLGRLPGLAWLLVCAACAGAAGPAVLPAQPGSEQATLPPPAFSTAPPPDAEGTAAAFLDAWQKGDYAGMHTLLTPQTAELVSAADFAQRYQDALDGGAIASVEATVLAALQQASQAEVQFKVDLKTGLVGSVSRQITMKLEFADSRWGILWDDGLILPELKDGGVLMMEYASPARGNIYDRSGLAFAAQTDAVAIGVVAGEILPEQEGRLLGELSRLLDVHPEALRSRYADAGPDWYVAMGEASIAEVSSRFGVLNNIAGLRLNQYQTRYYMGGAGGAPHAVGYVAPIPAEQVAAYLAEGYAPDAFVGAQGLEKSGEKQLAGERGGTLWVRAPSGALNTKLAEKRAGPAQAITTTLDRKLQREVQAALQGMTGAAVVVNYTTGEVLAMASSPAFDPNLFDPSNYNISQLSLTLNDALRPLINRVTQGQYPPGSAFKVVTLAAALESKLFVKDQTYYCGYEWTELGVDFVKYDWTYEKQVPESGTLNMVGALRRSCNPWFYHMGYSLHRWADYYLPDMARSFGFGPATGIVGLSQAANEEVGGVVPSADWAAQTNTDWTIGDSVNMAIGQGDLTVTPLQLVMAYGALANGGQLLRPQLVLQMAAPGAEPTYKFEPQPVGALPISAETLATVRQGMWEVVNEPSGTATFRFKGLRIPIYGKTGTAEDRPRRPHAWFAGYSDAKQAGKPDIAAVVVLENKGEGSEWAAPVFRRIIETYFYGEPKTLFHWEAELGLTAVPSPFPTFVPFTYVVQAGDSLASIALQNKVTMDELMQVNQLANPNALTEGQTIIIARGGVSNITLTPEFTQTPTP